MSFLKWTDGAKPGKRKRVDTSQDSKKEYEKKRVRSFQEHWKQSRDWLEFKDDAMFCQPCVEVGEKNPFVTGCKNFKVEALSSHESTKAHIRAYQQIKAKEVKKEATVAGRTLVKLREGEKVKMASLFKNAHFVVKNNLSFKLFNKVCEFDRSKGIDIGTTYTNDKSCATFAGIIAETEREKTREILKDASFLSVTCDGTSDFTGEEYESLFIRVSRKGSVEERFIDLGK